MITIRSARTEVPEDLFDEEGAPIPDEEPIELPEIPEPTDMILEGRLVTGKTRVELVYDEGELSGMEG